MAKRPMTEKQLRDELIARGVIRAPRARRTGTSLWQQFLRLFRGGC